MSKSTSTTDETLRFPSLTALRTAHVDLLKRHREEGVTPELFAEADVFIIRASLSGALLDDDDERWAAQSLLDYWSTLLYRANHEPPDANLREFDPELAPDLDDSLCPYQGLDAFRETNHTQFFGRHRLIAEMVDSLHFHSLLAIVGPSGSGKSSLERAGVIPALQSGALPNSETWRYVPAIIPGSDPLVSAAHALFAIQRPEAGQTAEHLAAQIKQQPSYILDWLRNGPPVVLVVDQFEEVFTLCDDASTREAFIAMLLALTERSNAQHTVILTMRSDFETFVARVPALMPAFEAGRIQVTPLSASELREAIEKPAELVGLKFEAGVVDALLQDILGEPAGLPLLQFTLLKLWEGREHNRVTWETYRRVGGGRLALARSADRFYDQLIPEEQVTAKRILLRMVRSGEGLEVTSSRVRRDALYQGGEARERIDRVLDKLLEERLVRLTPGTSAADDQVEVAHEALVRNWPRLVEWLEDEKAAIAVRRRLESRAAEWVRLGRGDGGLFDEVELREAERWLRGSEATYLGYDPALDALVAASEEALGRAEREREAIHARELAQARALAEANQRRIEEQEQTAQRLRRAVVIGRVASVVALIAAIAAVIFGAQVAEQADEVIRSGNALRAQAATAEAARAEAQTQQQTAVAAQAAADQQRATAEAARSAAEAARATAVVEQQNALEQGLLARSGQLAAQAQSALREEPQRSLLLAVEAVRIAASGAAEDTLTTTLNATNGIGLSGHSAEILATVLSSDGRWLASGSADQTVRVWTTSEGRPTASVVLPGHNGPVILLEASADNRWLVSASTDTTARIWDMASTDPAAGVRVLTGHNGPITALAISPNSRWLVTTSEDQTARLWDLNAADPATSGFVLRGHTGTVTSVAISANNRWIITGSLDSTARIWALEGGTVGKFTSLVRQRGDIRAVAISPDSRFFVTGGSDGSNNRRGRIELRTLTTSGSGESPSVLSADQGLVTQLVYSPNGRWLASVGTDRTVRMWNALSMTSATPESTVLSGHEQPISALVFSPDSRWLATASADQSAILWDVAAADPAASSYVLRGHDGPLTSTAMSATGALITGSADTSIRLWQIPPSERTAIIGGASIDQRINLACQTAGRNLTTEEWEQAFPGQPFRKTCPEF